GVGLESYTCPILVAVPATNQFKFYDVCVSEDNDPCTKLCVHVCSVKGFLGFLWC
ncbi:unnamed protein product, partial [Porites lobata]